MEVSSMACISKYLEVYKKWITAKPQVIGDIESTIRCLSYFTAGRFNNSSLASEFIYSMPNLIILFNDCLIYTTKYAHLKLPQFKSQIKIWLTILEYVESMLEVSAKRLWGEMGKWITIFVIQTLKAIMRLVIIHRNKERIVQNPAIPPLNREKLHKKSQYAEKIKKEAYVLPRTGKIVRSVNSSDGPLQTRVWAPLTPLDESLSLKLMTPESRRRLLFAETLYIIKPLMHLSTFLVKGNKNWLPWATALTLDLISIHMINKEFDQSGVTTDEREEMVRRRMNLLLYILRSPFYDKCSKTKIQSLLTSASKSIPFARFITEPIAKYLPHWQQTYFYMWSS